MNSIKPEYTSESELNKSSNRCFDWHFVIIEENDSVTLTRVSEALHKEILNKVLNGEGVINWGYSDSGIANNYINVKYITRCWYFEKKEENNDR